MIKSINLIRIAGALGAALVVVLQTGCVGLTPRNKPAVEEMPITTNSEEARALFFEGRELVYNNHRTEARALFDQAIAIDPDFAFAYLGRAVSATSNKDYREQLSRAVALAPSASEGERLLILSIQAYAENKPLKMVELQEQMVALYPNDKRAHRYLGRTYGGEDDRAIAEFRKAISIDPDYAPPYNDLGYAYMANDEYEQAEEAFKNYIRLIPADANSYDSMADLLTRIGRHEEAIEHYKKAVELNPTLGSSQSMVGLNQIYMGWFDEGRESIRQAVEMEPSPLAKIIDLEMIAFSYLFEGQPQQTLAEIDKAVELAAESKLPVRLAQIHSGICFLHAELGNLAEAEQSLAVCNEVVAGAELSPAVAQYFADQTLFNEAFIAAKRQNFETALAKADELKASIKAGADSKEIAGYRLLLGLIYLEKGEYTQALEHLADVDQDNPYNVYQLARAVSGTGNQDRATELYQKVARWNELWSNDLFRLLGYALVRPKALAIIEGE